MASTSQERILPRKELRTGGRVCLLGVNCNYGTDDPFFLSVLAIAVRATWIAYGIFFICYYFVQPGCVDAELPAVLTASLMGMMALHLINLLLFIAVAIISNLGSLRRSKPRRKNVFMLHVLLVLLLVELGWLVFTAYVAAARDLESLSNCTAYQHVVVLFDVSVASSWLISVLLLFLLLIGLDPCGCCTVVGLLDRIEDIKAREKRSIKLLDLECCLEDFNENKCQGLHGNSINSLQINYNLRQSCLCCRDKRSNHSSRAAMSDVVKAIGVLFGDFDVTFSDLVTGFLLTGHYQRELYEIERSSEVELTEATVKLLKDNGSVSPTYETPHPVPLIKQEVEELSLKSQTYLKYCLAAYGNLISVADSPVRDTLKLCQSARGCLCYPYFHSERYKGDGLLTNTFVIATTLNIPQSNIVTASYVNSVYEVPFFVTHDQDKKELVIAIRGTLSIQDALTDVSVAFVKVPGRLLGLEDAYVHRGFFESAVFVYKSLEACERFNSILESNELNKFVITGHSLGAAVASVLTIFFKDRYKDKPWVNKVEAFLFATPGAVMNYSLAERASDFTVSVIASNDIVPRATLRSLGYLRLMVETMLKTGDSTKHQVFCCVGGAWWQCYPPQVPQDEHLLGLVNETQKSSPCEEQDDVHERIQNYLPFTVTRPRWKQRYCRTLVDDFIQRIKKCRGGAYEDPKQPMMFMPGRVLHLEESEQYSTCSGQGNIRVTGSWKARESLSTILIHPDMVNDHLPHRYISHCKHLSHHDDRVLPTGTSSQQHQYSVACSQSQREGTTSHTACDPGKDGIIQMAGNPL